MLLCSFANYDKIYTMEEELLTISQASEYLGVSLNTLRRWDENGKLVAIRKNGGTHRYFLLKDLEVFSSDLIKLASDWVHSNTEFPGTFHCHTSSVFQGRITKMEHSLMVEPGFEKLYSLIVAITGEIGDNSFAHNLGNWPDAQGIFFGYDISKRIIVFLSSRILRLEPVYFMNSGTTIFVASRIAQSSHVSQTVTRLLAPSGNRAMYRSTLPVRPIFWQGNRAPLYPKERLGCVVLPKSFQWTSFKCLRISLILSSIFFSPVLPSVGLRFGVIIHPSLNYTTLWVFGQARPAKKYKNLLLWLFLWKIYLRS